MFNYEIREFALNWFTSFHYEILQKFEIQCIDEKHNSYYVSSK